jgi:hypothetical protein
MAHIQTGNKMVTQITVIEAEPEKQNEALSLMAERARFMASQPGFVYPFVIMGNTMPPRDPEDEEDEDEEDEDEEEEEDRADEPPVVREPDED